MRDAAVRRLRRLRPRGRRSQALLLLLLLLLLLAISLFYGPRLRHLAGRGSLPGAACAARLPREVVVPNATTWAARGALYLGMEEAFAAKGLEVFAGGASSQGLALADMFTISDAGAVRPVLKALDVPVRAIVMPFSDASASATLGAAVVAALGRAGLSPDAGDVWLQDAGLYHSSLWHASHHKEPVPVGARGLAAERAAIAAVTGRACPVQVALERVAVTTTGVLLACWQPVGGAEPVALRAALGAALPRSPKGQLYHPAILHTTLARLLRAPAGGAAAMAELASDLSEELCGLRMTIPELWFVQEHDLLALGLGGKFDKQPQALKCKGGGPGLGR